jgi:polar amino acid transport system substrate-binding protein
MKNPRIAAIAAAAVALLSMLTGCGGGEGGGEVTQSNGKAVDLGVPLPAAFSSAGKLRIGIACDYPPFGSKDMSGKNVGYDAEVARSLANYAFGDASKVEFTCVSPQNRIPYLESKKIDLIISTLGYTKERDKTIDYSTPYFTSGAKLLVLGDSAITGWESIKGKPVITKQGTTSSTYLANCFKDSEQVLLEGTSDAVTALKDGRGAAFVEDSTLLLGLTLTNPTLKVVGEDRAQTPWGIGLRQGETDTKKWVEAALADMQKTDKLWTILSNVVNNEEAVKAFAANMPRPGQNLEYTDVDTLTSCS